MTNLCDDIVIKNGGIFTCSLRQNHGGDHDRSHHIESEITVSVTFPPGTIRRDIINWTHSAPPIVRVTSDHNQGQSDG